VTLVGESGERRLMDDGFRLGSNSSSLVTRQLANSAHNGTSARVRVLSYPGFVCALRSRCIPNDHPYTSCRLDAFSKRAGVASYSTPPGSGASGSRSR